MDIVISTQVQEKAVAREEALSCRFPPMPVTSRDTVRVTIVSGYVGRHAELPTQIDLHLVSVDRQGIRRIIDRSTLVRLVCVRHRSALRVLGAVLIAIGAAITLFAGIHTANYPCVVLGAALAWLAGWSAHDASPHRHLSPPP